MPLAAVRAIHGPWQVSAQVREVSPGANATINCLLCLKHKINDVQGTKPAAQSVRYPRIRGNNMVVLRVQIYAPLVPCFHECLSKCVLLRSMA